MPLLLIVFCIYFSLPASADVLLQPTDIVSVYDGDTFTVNIGGCPELFCSRLPVRINGIDTPEIRGKCQEEKEKAKAAKQFLADRMAQAKRIDLIHTTRERKYFRILADVLIDGVDIGQEMLSKGLARPYHGEHRSGWCPSPINS